MDWLFYVLLLAHILGAIVAFGPTFAFPLIASSAAADPQHLNFALKTQKRIASTLVTPLALVEGVTGLLLVWKIGFDVLWHWWLLISIALYLGALAVSFGVIYPALRVLIAATAAPPPAGAAPAGPPPHIAAARDRAKLGGQINLVLIVAIVALMFGGARGLLP